MVDDIHELSGPLLLLAGPGTGKTYRLGKRIKFLVEELEVPPENITVITFTAAAAKNMRDRISDFNKPDLYLPYKKQPKAIRTMHSLGYKIIGRMPQRLALRILLRLLRATGLEIFSLETQRSLPVIIGVMVRKQRNAGSSAHVIFQQRIKNVRSAKRIKIFSGVVLPSIMMNKFC